MTELLEEGLVTREEVEQMWESLPKAANSIKAAGVPGVDKGTLINFQGFLEFDRQVTLLFYFVLFCFAFFAFPFSTD